MSKQQHTLRWVMTTPRLAITGKEQTFDTLYHGCRLLCRKRLRFHYPFFRDAPFQERGPIHHANASGLVLILRRGVLPRSRSAASDRKRERQRVAPVDDAEAEAVLLALGPKLEWTDADEEWGVLLAQTDRLLYALSPVEAGKLFRVDTFTGEPEYKIQDRQVKVASLEVAKAACERHYASRLLCIREGTQGDVEGKWE